MFTQGIEWASGDLFVKLAVFLKSASAITSTSEFNLWEMRYFSLSAMQNFDFAMQWLTPREEFPPPFRHSFS